MDDLSLLTTDELLDELEARTDAGVAIVVRLQSEDRYQTQHRWWGCHVTCVGACRIIEQAIARSFDESPNLPGDDVELDGDD